MRRIEPNRTHKPYDLYAKRVKELVKEYRQGNLKFTSWFRVMFWTSHSYFPMIGNKRKVEEEITPFISGVVLDICKKRWGEDHDAITEERLKQAVDYADELEKIEVRFPEIKY